MSYHFSKKLDLPFAEAVDKAIAALKARGFGVLTRIDVQSTLKEKIGADFDDVPVYHADARRRTR